MQTMKTGKLDELLGNDAASLLDHQCKTIHCQPFAREHGIVEDWRR